MVAKWKQSRKRRTMPKATSKTSNKFYKNYAPTSGGRSLACKGMETKTSRRTCFYWAIKRSSDLATAAIAQPRSLTEMWVTATKDKFRRSRDLEGMERYTLIIQSQRHTEIYGE